MSRIQLSSIPALTFYKETLTKGRRTAPISQLTCVGRPCKIFTPDVVRCTNVGGTGTDVDWKCTADLPESIRFGRTEVSCEGWDRPGDAYVLKGSCALEYRLVDVPAALRQEAHHHPRSNSDVASTLFAYLWFAVALIILYSFVRSCLQNDNTTTRRPRSPPPYNPSNHGYFPGSHPDDSTTPPPPPYTPNSKGSGSAGTGAWRPGFWTGAVAGGLANHLWNNRRNNNEQPPPPPPRRQWDWERSSSAFTSGLNWGSGTNQRSSSSEDRGEGSSRMGSMRESTGYGGSSTR